MGVITALFAGKVIDAAGDRVDRAALLARVGLSEQDAPQVQRMVPDADYYALLEEIAAQLHDATDFPLRVGASMRCDDYGAFGLAWKTAPVLRGSLERAERYARLLTSVSQHQVRDHPKGALFILQRDGARRLGLRLSNEATLASTMAIMREVSTEPVNALEVRFRHPAPRSTGAHEEYFGGRAVFGAEMDAILMASTDLARQNRLGDPAISRFLEPLLEQELAAASEETSLEQVLLRQISDRLSDGPPKAAEMARIMGMSERTLNRRLSQEGLSYGRVLEKARRRLAEGLLARSGHSLTDIAFLTGFSEQSSLTRAFRRWTGQTPAAWRDAAAGR